MFSEHKNDWQESSAEVFWGEIAPCSHVVQIFDRPDVLLDAVEGFISSGFIVGEAVVIIATAEHLNKLEKRLYNRGFKVDELRLSDHYITLNADETLPGLLVDGQPDEDRFLALTSELLKRARGKNGRKVRLYGEMVTILWTAEQYAAALSLENLWERFCMTGDLSLLCAYPESGFSGDKKNSVKNIYDIHTKVIAVDRETSTEVFYRDTRGSSSEMTLN